MRSVIGWVGLLALAAAPVGAAELDCLSCHGDRAVLERSAASLRSAPRAAELDRMVVDPGLEMHMGLACDDCHAIEGFPHRMDAPAANPCVACHEDAAAEVNRSVHRDPMGGDGFALPCWGCHGAHEILPPSDERSPLHPYNVSDVCLTCHEQQSYLAGVHGMGVELSGLTASATCISCHGDHEIQSASKVGARTARRQISFTCGECHGRIADVYRTSVHGAALMAEDNADVPTCVDCHQPHQTVDPRSPVFRATSPELCAGCHADDEMMARYDLSTEVFDTYVADFHGTTAQLFEAVTPNQPLNQAVCYDCHGYHDVYAVHDVGKEQIESNLLRRCQACHPNATGRFLSAWTSHYIPSPERYPWIYYVRLFYRFAIPGIVGFFLLYIALDVRRTRSAGGHGGPDAGGAA